MSQGGSTPLGPTTSQLGDFLTLLKLGLSFLICIIYLYGSRNNTSLVEAAVRSQGKSAGQGLPSASL